MKGCFPTGFLVAQGFVQRGEVKGFERAIRTQILPVVTNEQLTIHEPYVGFDGMESFIKGVVERDGLFVVVV